MLEILNSDWVKDLGPTALMFACLYLMLKSNSQNIEALITSMQQNNANMFQLFEKLFDSTMLNSGMLQRIAEAVSTNKWCPIVRKYLNTGITPDVKDAKEGENND